MTVYDFVKECEYDVKITDYVTEEVLFATSDVIEHYEEIKYSDLGKRVVAFVTAEDNSIVVRAFAPVTVSTKPPCLVGAKLMQICNMG